LFLGIDVGSISMKFALYLPEGSVDPSPELRSKFLDPEAVELPGGGKGYVLSYDRLLGDPVRKVPERLREWIGILGNGRALPIQHSSGAPGLFVTKVSESHRRDDGTVEERVLYEYQPATVRQAVASGDAYAMTYLMKGVVENGTGTRAKRLRRPVAGKTGTTNSYRDVWFMGGTADLVVGVWVGRLTPTKIAEKATGGSVALPIWEGFMEAAHPVTEQAPARDFPIPDDVTLFNHGDRREGVPDLLPFQRGKMPQSFLTVPAADFGASPFD
jgi:hypothetical protein